MNLYVPVESSVNAAVIANVSVVTTATLDDGSSVVVPDDFVAGDFVVQYIDGTFKFVKRNDFLVHFKAA